MATAADPAIAIYGWRYIMILTRYNRNGFDSPLALMDDMRRELDRLFADGPFALSPVTSARSPRSAVSESEDAYTFRMEVPGLTPEALDVKVEDGVLHLAGERNDEAPEGFEPRRKERVRYRFDRRVPLPDTVDAERIEAALKDGLLVVTLPKTEKPAPRKIAVKAS